MKAPARGTIVLMKPRKPTGHEQGGSRPAVCVLEPKVAKHLRGGVLVVVPLTTAVDKLGKFYPVIPPRPGGLPEASGALVDQIVAISIDRAIATPMVLSPAELELVDHALSRVLGLV